MTLTTEDLVCLDTETTGLDIENDSIIEVAAVRFRGKEIIDTFETLINPRKMIPEESQKIHHINDDMVKDKPSIKEVLPIIFDFVKNTPIIGHAINFDLEMIKKESKVNNTPYPLHNNKFIDTLRLSRLYGQSPDNSLESLRKHFNIEETGAHRAMNDVMTNIKVFNFLTSKYKNTEQIFNVLSKPINMKRMPLGKHKGRNFYELPLPYLKWAVRQNFDQDLLFSIKQELKKRQQGLNFFQSANPFQKL